LAKASSGDLLARKKSKPSGLKLFFAKLFPGLIKTDSGKKKRPRPRRRKRRRSRKKIAKLSAAQQTSLELENDIHEARKPFDEVVEEERKVEKRPLSERLSGFFYKLLKRPANRLAKSIKGLDLDLVRSNLKITPEAYVSLMLGVSLIMAAAAAVITPFLVSQIVLMVPIAFVAFVFSFMIIRTQPRRIAKARTIEANRMLPYVLRHMGTQLSSGIGLPETMTSVSNADYGSLSEEFGRIVREMHTGVALEDALTAMDERLNSDPLHRGIRHIQRTLRTGGDLAKTLNVLADETAFEMRMKLRDYIQSLNMLTMVYMFASAVIPSMLLITVSISIGGRASSISPQAIAVIYLILLPFMLFYFVMMIKRFEPRL
jgi:pilus assembly protein TadC